MNRWPLSVISGLILVITIIWVTGPTVSVANQDATGDTGVVNVLGAGGSHTCAWLPEVGAKCWGNNDFGELGNGGNLGRTSPSSVINLTEPIDTLAAGEFHTCARLVSGGIKCWGRNNYGQLGDSSNDDSNIPVAISGLTGVSVLAAGNSHTCIALSGGGVKCWGRNNYGQLGNATNTDSNSPVTVSSLSSVVIALTGGFEHTCAALFGGGVNCWGRNNHGQLGNNSTSDSNTPVTVSGLTAVVIALAAGEAHTCALLADKTVECWGSNFYGQLGIGLGYIESHVPAIVSSGIYNEVNSITAGSLHTCVGLTDQGVVCWGDWSHNQMGQNFGGWEGYDPHYVPRFCYYNGGTSAIASGGLHSCVAFNEGTLFCWGDNQMGQLGNGEVYSPDISNSEPTFVKGLYSVNIPLIIK